MVSFIPCLARRDAILERDATLLFSKEQRAPLRTFHVGNSLTANASRFTTFFRTAGGTNLFPKFIIGGSTTERLGRASPTKTRPTYSLT